jgi:hypothetical protein
MSFFKPRLAMSKRFLAAACALALAACSSAESELPRGHYPVAKEDALQKLLAAPTLEFKLARHCGVLIHLIPRRSGDVVRWSVYSSNRETFYFEAKVVSTSEKSSRVEIAVGPKEANGREAYDGTQDYYRPAMQQPIRPGIEEFIDSTMKNRPYVAEGLPFKDGVCSVQRGGLESGTLFTVDDSRRFRSVRALEGQRL